MNMGKKRMAVLVGCNYPNTENELYGCINDVHAMRKLLVKQFGFEPNHMEILTDEPESQVKPTGANIKRALDRMVDQAEAGDVLFLHYSGHGTRIPSKHHLMREEEAIVPCDFNLITDVDFWQLVNRLPREASFTIISDSCHSGGLIDKEKEQIGPFSTPTTTATATAHHHHSHGYGTKSKSIPYESILQHLASLTNIATSDIGTHLTAFFGEDASTKFRIAQLEVDLYKQLHPDSGILLSGCQANETSADVPGNAEGNAYGAFSNAVQMVFKKNHGPLTNREVVMMARKILKEQGVEQHPCLYCSDDNADAYFLWQSEDS